MKALRIHEYGGPLQLNEVGQPAAAPELKLVVYPGGPHTFDMRLPDRTVLGMRLGYDPDADTDARRQVIDFLAAHGLVAKTSPLIGAGSSRRAGCE